LLSRRREVSWSQRKVYRPLERRNFSQRCDLPDRARPGAEQPHQARARQQSVTAAMCSTENLDSRRISDHADAPRGRRRRAQVFAQSNGAILMEYFGDEEAARPMLKSGTRRARKPRNHCARLSTTSRCGSRTISSWRLVAVQPALLGKSNRRDRLSAGGRCAINRARVIAGPRS